MKVRWRHDMAVIDNTIVGSISEAHGNYYAYGAIDDWEDTNLGCFSDKADAKAAIEDWIEAHSELV